jgi:imidazolonepropionase-like amidohydrolase
MPSVAREYTPPLAIRGGTLFDGVGEGPRPNDLLVICHDRIARVGGQESVPPGATLIDAEGLSILPGFIDLHVHYGALAREAVGLAREQLQEDYLRLRPGVRRALLRAGVTTIRSVGDIKATIFALKGRIASGQLVGPRVFCTGPVFTAPGGHPAGTLYKGDAWLITHGACEVTCPEQAWGTVRTLAAEGVDGIKAVYAGGTLPKLSYAVLRAIVEAAHAYALWAAVHTSSIDEVQEAVWAGADTIEHGVTSGACLDAHSVAVLRSRDVTYVPTLAVAQALWSTTQQERVATLLANTSTAHAGGVRIGLGTDTQGGNMQFGASVHEELALLVRAGLTPSAALAAATRNAATALRMEHQLGTVEPGKLADLVLVEGEPWHRVSDAQNVRLVIQNGRVVCDARTSMAT